MSDESEENVKTTIASNDGSITLCRIDDTVFIGVSEGFSMEQPEIIVPMSRTIANVLIKELQYLTGGHQ